MAFSRFITIINEKGLHARASARFVEVVEKFNATACIKTETQDVDGSSILDLLLLGASCGTEIEIETDGEEAEQLLKALIHLLDTKFGEEN